MSEQFYLTLPSNSSMDIFPDNKITHFKTQLCKPIVLQGEYEVGIAEVHYPCTFRAISDSDFWVGYEFDPSRLSTTTEEEEG